MADLRQNVAVGDVNHDVIHNEERSELAALATWSMWGAYSTIPPWAGFNNYTPGQGVLTLYRWICPVSFTSTNAMVYIATAGATLTASTCYACAYDSGGTLLGQTADQSTTWTSTGTKTMAWASSISFTGGTAYYLGFLASGTTNPTFASCTAASVNFGTSGASVVCGTTGSALTAPPATVTMSGLASLGRAMLIGVK